MALPIAAAIGGWVVAKLQGAAGSIIARGLAALGIGYATYNFAMPEVKAYIINQFGGVPPDMLRVILLAKVDVCFSIILSAIAAKMTQQIVWKMLPGGNG